MTKPDPAVEKFWAALHLLKSREPADQAAGRTALQAAADLEYTHAQTLLADCLLAGAYGFKKDPKKAVNLYRLAAERGNAFAKVNLGEALFLGRAGRKDPAGAATWLNAAVKPDADYSRPERPRPTTAETAEDDSETVAGEIAHDPESVARASAHYFLALILTEQKQLAAAQEHFVLAANAGPAGRDGIFYAAQMAAMNYAFGHGVPRDFAKASAMLDVGTKLTARAGVTMIHNYVSLKVVDEFAVADLEEEIDKGMQQFESAFEVEIANSFADRKSKDYDVKEAIRWYRIAAENGQAWAMLDLAFIYCRGDAGKPDPAEAFRWFEKAGGGEKPKHFLAAANLGICYQQGYGVPADPKRAAEIFAKYKDRHILCYLGTKNAAPATPQTFAESIALLEKLAKDQHDPQAEFLMGRRYAEAWDVPFSAKDAVKWLKKATKADLPAAFDYLGHIRQSAWGIFDSGSLDKARADATACFARGTELGDVPAMVDYSIALAQGTGVPRDAARAERIIRQALAKDPASEAAHNDLAVMLSEQLRTAQASHDNRSADSLRVQMLAEYTAAARLKNPQAAQNLGNLYFEGTIVPQDYHAAYGYYEQAADLGSKAAHFRLGLMHEQGLGVPRTMSEAAYHYRLAALDGSREALRHLIRLYLTGQGVSKDLDRAEFWLGRMVDMGDDSAMVTFWDVLLEKGEYDRIFDWIKRVADRSGTDPLVGAACFRIAECYRLGHGAKVNPKAADTYFQKALGAGDPNALLNQGNRLMKAGNKDGALALYARAAQGTNGTANYYLGQMYFFGTNVPADRDKAVTYLRTAASHDHPGALYFLAGMTYNHEVGAPTLEEAIQFAGQAEGEGLTKAAVLREKLEQRRREAAANDDGAAPPHSP